MLAVKGNIYGKIVITKMEVYKKGSIKFRFIRESKDMELVVIKKPVKVYWNFKEFTKDEKRLIGEVFVVCLSVVNKKEQLPKKLRFQDNFLKP